MSTPDIYQLTSVSVLDVTGRDAEKIVHNLTTNEIKTLAVHHGRESFITDVKGKTLGHVLVYRRHDCFRLIGAGGQSSRIESHADRYTIVEDAVPRILDDQFVAFVVAPEAVHKLSIPAGEEGDELRESVDTELRATIYGAAWLGRGTVVLLIAVDDAVTTKQQLSERALIIGDDSSFHHRRVIAGFPWYGVDFDEQNLPQEVDRNAAAISFTKGCYLGQETVARLDAMGQVQKKLVRWSLQGEIPCVGTELFDGDKRVARLTSIAAIANNEAVAIGMARRSHFESGAQAMGATDGGGGTFTAVVL